MFIPKFEINSERNTFGKVIIHRSPKKLSIQLYQTIVFTKTDKTITLNSGGWLTNTTKQTINSALHQLGLGYNICLYQKAGHWLVQLPNRVVPFKDGMRVRY